MVIVLQKECPFSPSMPIGKELEADPLYADGELIGCEVYGQELLDSGADPSFVAHDHIFVFTPEYFIVIE